MRSKTLRFSTYSKAQEAAGQIGPQYRAKGYTASQESNGQYTIPSKKGYKDFTITLTREDDDKGKIVLKWPRIHDIEEFDSITAIFAEIGAGASATPSPARTSQRAR